MTLLSITDYAVDLTLLSEPLIPLPEAMLLKPAPAPVRPNSYTGCQPSPTLALSPAVLSRKGPFTEPADTSDHPLITFGLTGCPYHMTTYREDVPQMDTSFGMHLHHPSASAPRRWPGCWVVPWPSGFR